MDERVSEHVDQATRLTWWHTPGVVVVAVEQPFTPQRYEAAIGLLHGLKSHPLEIAAVALPPGIVPPPEVVMQLADDGIAVVRDEGESARARAQAYLQTALAPRRQGLAHLRNSMGLNPTADRPRRSKHAAR